MSIEHGSKMMSAKDYIMAKSLYEEIGQTLEENNKLCYNLIPFDVILSHNDGKGKDKIFNKRLQQLANRDIDGEDSGFLIRNTHMRLGSKVHIHSFYEMPFLFYRTSIANRIAYEILYDICKRRVVDIEYDKIMFYGYASYSKAILTSITEILRAYRKQKNLNGNDVSFVSYQHNLRSESEDVQMHYGFLKEFPAKIENNKVETKELIKVIQVVPISSTLTTFEKMWGRFKKSIKEGCEKNFQLTGNYTIFWVTNEIKDNPRMPSEIEETYWSEIKIEEQIILTRFKEFINQHANQIRFFIRCPVKWEHPLKCKWCYPQQLIDEIPLVETDPTSTVPTQQIRKKREIKQRTNFNENVLERMKSLKGCVSYGHIVREQNHFQYYIDTQRYFYKVKNEVKDWLQKCREKDKDVKDYPMMYVIFSPEHATNVGFAQYVNTYYFGGVAEIVSINEDKEFRSNFECEHAALIESIKDLYRYIEVHSLKDMPIKFYFVDDTIISGETFQKANSFLRSLLPKKYRNNYGTNIISKCFLLVDRLSSETKRNYVRDIENDFYSFIHIDISNMRTQGDSCIGCKLKQDAIRLFKRSTTRNTEIYWAEKIRNYIPVAYDNRKEIEKYQTEEAYQRLILSHIAQNTIFTDNDSFEIGKAYDSILVIAFRIMGKKRNIKSIFNYDNLISEINKNDGIGKFLKIISRPFFSFDFKIKMQVLTLIIILTEILLENKEVVQNYKYDPQNTHVLKKFITENNRIKDTLDLGQCIFREMNDRERLDFLQNILFESMTDMKSTYLLRKDTLCRVYNFMKNYPIEIQEVFWKNYAQNVHRIVDCSSDEMRSLSFEYLLLCGDEYENYKMKFNKKGGDEITYLYGVITGQEKPEKRDPFYIFCYQVLFQNTRILFDGIEKNIDRDPIIDTYYMEQWRGFRNLEKQVNYSANDNRMPLDSEKALFEFLRNRNDGNKADPRTLVKERYETLLKKILIMVEDKYGLNKDTTKIALLTRTQDKDELETRAVIGELDILTDINVFYPEK